METVGLYPVTRDDDDGPSHAWEPIVLFRSGEAALGIHALADPDGDKLLHPDHWTRWRRTKAGYEYRSRDGWRPVSSTIEPAPRNLKLEGRYAHEWSGPGSAGAMSSVSWRSLSFDRSGHFTMEDGGRSDGPRFTASAQTRTVDGTYDITGYNLTLSHHDGHVETHSIVLIHDSKVIWIDGIEYIRQR